MEKSQTEIKLINKVSKYKEPFRTICLRLHEIIMETKPELMPSFMYGMPAYRNKETREIFCFFRHDEYVTFGLQGSAKLEFREAEGKIQPVAWYLEEINQDVEKQIKEILKQAIK